jgi:cyclase
MKRIIARLDIKGPNLVKGIHLEGLRVLGSPSLFARSYYESGVDELFYQDVVASLYDRNGLFDLIKSVAKETFIPLTVSGGIRTLGDIKRALRHGADKVCINTGAFQNTEFIKNAALEYGSSTIVVAIEAIKQKGSSYLAYTDNGREHTGVDVLKWAQEVSELGAGEIILTSIDNEGTGKGYDCELTKKVSDGSADAVAIASLFHYGLARYDEEFTRGSSEGNLEFLKKKNFSLFQTATVQDVKKYLLENNIKVRAM